MAEQSRIVRLPLNKVGLTNRIQKAFSQLEQQFEREPSAEELAELLEMDLEEVSASLSISSRHVSMDTPISEGEDGYAAGCIGKSKCRKNRWRTGP